VSLLVLVFAAALCAAAADPGPYIDMTSDSINGPGIGFAFSSSDSMFRTHPTAASIFSYLTLCNDRSSATALLSQLAPTCKFGSLDELYFYVYGCR
jgi:hypothetical protein